MTFELISLSKKMSPAKNKIIIIIITINKYLCGYVPMSYINEKSIDSLLFLKSKNCINMIRIYNRYYLYLIGIH